MAVLMYENPVTIKEDPDTGLLLLVDGTGKTIARAATPNDLVQLGKNKGVYSGDLPEPNYPSPAPQQPSKLDELKAKRDKLSREYTAIQNEFSSGKNFKSGEAEADREAREIAKYKELRAVNEQIRQEEGQTSAKGQTTDSKPPPFNYTAGAGQGNNSSSPTASDGSTTLSAGENKKLETNQQNAALIASTDTSGTATTQKSEATADGKSQTTSDFGIGTSSTGTTNTKDSNTNKTVPATTLYNKLHDYTAYTYRITLFLLTADEFTVINNNPEKFSPKWVLISSGGAFSTPPSVNATSGANNPGRHPDFQEDFYFDNLNITTVVGLNSKTKASNAIDIKFNIIEPYGMSLLDRLLSACYTTAQCANYVDQPYLLQIDFLSNVGEGVEKTNIIDTKRIPIKITEFKIKPSSSGTKYEVRAMPYNHVAFLQSASSVPVNLSVKARTVGDFFDSKVELQKIFDADAAKNEERIEEALNKYKFENAGLTEDDIERQRAKLKADFKYAFSAASFPAGYNTYFRNLAYNTGVNRFEQPLYQIAFNIHPDIATSQIVDPKDISSEKTPMTSSLASYLTTTAKGADPKFKDSAITNVLSGSSIMGVIERVVSASEYITNQVRKADKEAEEDVQQDTTSTDSNARTTTNKSVEEQKIGIFAPRKTENKKVVTYRPTDWFKVIPSVTLGGYDNKGKTYSKFITFSILPYKAANAYHPDFKFTKISAKQCVRTYNYYYTGKNQDIISMDIDFDATFITGVTTYLNQAQRGGNNIKSATESIKDNEVSDDRPPSWLPFSIRPTPVDTQLAGSKASRTSDDIAVASVSRSLYSAYPRGDMLNIKIKIIGDPAFIKQDDIYNNPIQANYGNTVKTTLNSGTAAPVNPDNGQILFDNEQVFVQLIVKSISDIDDDLGLISDVKKKVKLTNGETANGSFSGIYRVMTVESVFSNGKFEQLVDLIRMPDDLAETDIKPILLSAANGGNATASVEQQAANEQIPPSAGTVFSNPRPENVPVVDPALKQVAQGSATNPTSSSSGNGTPPITSQPTAASATNINNAGNKEVLPQETAPEPRSSAKETSAKANELFEQLTTVEAEYKTYLREWEKRYDVYRNAPESEKNTAANIQTRIDLQIEFKQKTVEFTNQKLNPILQQELALKPFTPEVGKLLNRINVVAATWTENLKTTNSAIDKLTQKLQSINN
jgi:hypothetical protein